MAVATTVSPSPSERRRDASDRADTCASHGAAGLPAVAIAPGISSRGLAHAVRPRAIAMAQNAEGQSADLKRRNREGSGCCGNMANRLGIGRVEHGKVNRLLPSLRGKIAAAAWQRWGHRSDREI